MANMARRFRAGRPAGERSVAGGHALGEPAYRYYYLAQVGSQCGSLMQQATLLWLVYAATRSPVMVGYCLLAQALPPFLCTIPASVIGDRCDLRRLLIAIESVACMLALLSAGLVWCAAPAPWALIALAGVTSLVSSWEIATIQAYYPRLIAPARLPSAVSMQVFALYLSRAVGPALTGLLLTRWAPGTVLLTNAVTFVPLLAVLAALPETSTPTPSPPTRGTFAGELREGIAHLWSVPALRRALCLYTCLAVAGLQPIQALLPVIAGEQSSPGVVGYGLLAGGWGLGGLIVSAALSRRAAGIDPHAIGTLALTCGVATFLLARLPGMPFALPLVVALGMGMGAIGLAILVAVRLATPARLTGRAIGLISTLNLGTQALGAWLGGMAAWRLGAGTTLTIAASALLLLPTLFTLSSSGAGSTRRLRPSRPQRR